MPEDEQTTTVSHTPFEPRSSFVHVCLTERDKERARRIVKERGLKSLSEMLYPAVIARINELDRVGA
jgi:hypothetical protein